MLQCSVLMHACRHLDVRVELKQGATSRFHRSPCRQLHTTRIAQAFKTVSKKKKNEKAKLAAAGVSQTALLPLMQLLDVLEYLVLHNLSLAPDSQPQPYSPQEVLAVQSHLNHANAHVSTAQLQEFLKARLDIKLSSSLAMLALANLVSRFAEP